MRIDKFISNIGYASRKEIAKYIKNGFIKINGKIVLDKEFKINFGDIIGFGDEEIEYREFVTIILNKPKGYVSSSKPEGGHQSYLDLLYNCPYAKLLHIVGRLDFDTSGLLLLTNDGNLTHNIINPKKEIFKKYLVTIKNDILSKDIKKLGSGVKIDDIITKPAIVEKIDEKNIYLSISEGKFHQVKKMMQSIGNEVLELKRISIGEINLGDLKLGEWKYFG